ncbi:MAG: response regulator [Clostridia bacterium]|nr:response regulator [Clostridia bacterium]
MNLYNVLIVDDESFVVDCISNLLETQDDLNIFIYKAYTPARAQALIEHTRIDLLISDIRMPSCSGFELSKKLRQLWPNSKTILLTAYSDFHYAQKAIQQGITSYVLKTSEDSEILSEIKKALRNIEREFQQLALFSNIEKDLKNYQTRMNTQVFSSWLEGYYVSAELSENIRVLGFDLEASNRFMLLICRPDSATPIDTKQLKNAIKPFQIQKILDHNLSPHLMQSFYGLKSDLLVGILQLHASAPDEVSQMISSALELAQITCVKTLNDRISCLISPECTLAEIPALWSLGKSLLPSFADKSDFVFSYKRSELSPIPDLSSDENSVSPLFRASFYKDMEYHLENGNQSAFQDLMNQVCAYLRENANWHNNYTLQIYYSLALVFISYINKKNIASQIDTRVNIGMLFRPWHADAWTDIEDDLNKITDTLFALRESQESNIVQKIRYYINTHITEDISLQDLTNATGYSANYLSKYYSDSTGTTISEYIANRKLEKISRLMKNTDMNFGEIASSMGFHSRTYFNYYIKRLTGMSPQQYKATLTAKSESDKE